MSSPVFNPLTGKNSTGPRFCFRVHAIGHRILHLPLPMRENHYVQKLMSGLSPLEVFSCSSIEEARKKFFILRMKFDFPYWAALNYKVRDIASGKVVPLILNRHQRWLAEQLAYHAHHNPSGKFLISKTSPRCGLTTLIQAYVLWMQSRSKMNSFTFTASSWSKDALIHNICRSVGHQLDSYAAAIFDSQSKAFFLDAYDPNAFDNVPCALIHLSDMSKWHDPRGEKTANLLSGAMKAWYKSDSSFIILEGDRFIRPGFNIVDHQNPYIPQSVRLMNIGDFCNNAFFIHELVKIVSPGLFSDFFHINLDKAF